MPRMYQLEYLLAAEARTDECGQTTWPAHREWFGSERDAVTRRLELFKSGKLLGKKRDAQIWPVDVPTRKEDLLAWLRKEAV